MSERILIVPSGRGNRGEEPEQGLRHRGDHTDGA
jgi:hypothetical protein